jgi:hypothetical protein
MKRLLFSYLLGIFCLVSGMAQDLSQTVRGTILNAYTEQPVAGVGVRVLTSNPPVEAVSDERGEFRLEKVPIGRHDIAFAHPDYLSFTRPGILVSSAKEVVLDIRLEDRYYEMDEVTLVPPREKGKPRNELAAVSAISFEVEETRKFAGGLDDPTRLAANFPGVVDNSFISDNLISVRANSPRGLMYRLEGIELPNPNHFARIGSSGGTFTIFSNNLLTNSDFLTAAFPAEYGNATAGVFDIRFRNGNNQRREYALQASVLGVDLMAEGPFKEGGEASYLVNYRFSTLTVANLVINYLQLPEFQDLSFKLNFPTRKAGTFGVFGIGGISSRLREAETDPDLWVEDLDRFELQLDSDMGAVGVTHKLALGKKSVWQSALVGSYSQQVDNRTYLEDDQNFRLRDRNEYRRQPISFSSSVQTRFSPRFLVKSGIMLTSTRHQHWTQAYDYVENELNTLVDEAGETFRAQAYTQSQLRLTEKLSLNLGLHFLYFDLNDQYSIEPRASLKYQINRQQSLALGYGRHSQIESFATYVLRLPDASGQLVQPNLDLDFVKSHHFVLGYYLRFLENHQLRAEAYYQRLFNVPTEANGSFSVLNLSELDQIRALENIGEGYNAGVDLSLERYTQNGLYYLLNLSIFDSRYVGGDGVWRSTAFNNGYKANMLLGKEKRVGKTNNHFLGLNGALSLIGPRRYTPIDLEASKAARETVFDESRAWEGQEQPLLVLDFTLTYRRNKERTSSVWAVQIKNLLQNALPEYREYDALLDQEVTLVGAAILPVISYKLEF